MQGPQFHPWSGNEIPRATSKDPACHSKDLHIQKKKERKKMSIVTKKRIKWREILKNKSLIKWGITVSLKYLPELLCLRKESDASRAGLQGCIPHYAVLCANCQQCHVREVFGADCDLWLCGSQQTVENSSRDGDTRPPDLPPEKSICRSGSTS